MNSIILDLISTSGWRTLSAKQEDEAAKITVP